MYYLASQHTNLNMKGPTYVMNEEVLGWAFQGFCSYWPVPMGPRIFPPFL